VLPDSQWELRAFTLLEVRVALFQKQVSYFLGGEMDHF
jgi:hypothetical protein